MTLHPFRREGDISPGDQLDGWLNARTERDRSTSSERPWARADADVNTDKAPAQDRPSHAGESLTGAAHEFHAWAEDVQERDPAAKGPADDLWNMILAGSGQLHVDPAQPNKFPPGRGRRHVDPVQEKRRATDMSTSIGVPMGGYAPPKSNRTRKAEVTPPLSRSGAWFNAIAAALLLLSLGGGAYLMSNGGFGFGGGGDESGRFAAQMASPEASPETAEIIGSIAYQADGVCEVEPLTEDEVFEIVMNPLYGFAHQGIVLEDAGTPEPLLEIRSPGGGQRPSESPDPDYPDRNVLHQATEDEGASVNAFVTEYYECLQSGTNLQVWGLIMPYAVQERILLNFPVLRSEAQIRDHIAEVGPQAYSDSGFSLGHDYYFEQGYTLQGNPVPLTLWVNADDAFGYPGVKPDAVILSGVSLVDESGEVVAAVNYDGRPTFLQSDSPGVPETLEIAYFGETNTWYIAATYSLKG